MIKIVVAFLFCFLLPLASFAEDDKFIFSPKFFMGAGFISKNDQPQNVPYGGFELGTFLFRSVNEHSPIHVSLLGLSYGYSNRDNLFLITPAAFFYNHWGFGYSIGIREGEGFFIFYEF